MPIPVEAAAGSRDQRQDVSAPETPCASGTVRWTGEVAAEKILLPLNADDQYGGAARHSAPTPGVGSPGSEPASPKDPERPSRRSVTHLGVTHQPESDSGSGSASGTAPACPTPLGS